MTRPTAPAPLTLPACPTWCTRAGRHTAGDVMEAGGQAPGMVRLVMGHQGPTFGAFTVGTDVDVTTGETVSADAQLDVVELDRMGIDGTRDPAVLRQLAADATAAADWLEANR